MRILIGSREWSPSHSPMSVSTILPRKERSIPLDLGTSAEVSTRDGAGVIAASMHDRGLGLILTNNNGPGGPAQLAGDRRQAAKV
jgi:hypothetical protein